MREIVKPEVGSRLLLPLACLIVLIAGLRAAEPVVVPFLLSVFLAMLGFPLLMWLRRLGVPQSISIIVVVLGLVVVLVGVGAIVGGSVNAFTQALPQYQERLTLLLLSGEEQLASWGVNVSFSTVVGDLINPGQILQLAGGLLSRLAGIVSSFLLVFSDDRLHVDRGHRFSGQDPGGLGRRRFKNAPVLQRHDPGSPLSDHQDGDQPLYGHRVGHLGMGPGC